MLQKTFLPDVSLNDWQNLCPICHEQKIYKKTETVKNGYAYIDDFGQYQFAQTGWRENTIEWWSCKKCANKLSTSKYNTFLIENFNNIF